jgi:hypothetical protein
MNAWTFNRQTVEDQDIDRLVYWSFSDNVLYPLIHSQAMDTIRLLEAVSAGGPAHFWVDRINNTMWSTGGQSINDVY